MPRITQPVDLPSLIRAVEQRTSGDRPLERVRAAMEFGEILKDLGDQLIGHFVDEARAAGCSWAQIGAHLGVTKQAAQQRHRMPGFFDRMRGRSGGRWFERFTDEARQVVVRAQDEARRLKHNYVGTEHLLLGLLRERQGVAADALRPLGISLPAARREVKRIIGMGSEDPAGPIPFTPRAKKVFELALGAARSRGESHIRNHHMLIGLVEEGQGVAGQILRDHGVTGEKLQEALAK